MNKKLLFGTLLAFISLVNPGCKHHTKDTGELYMKYLKSHLKK